MNGSGGASSGDLDMKTPRKFSTSDRPNGGDEFTYSDLEMRFGEDVDALDHCHRLLKAELPPDIVSFWTGLPLESVLYVKVNNYET
jgi:hypothetical protein